MLCRKCNKEIVEGKKFCTSCGTPVDALEEHKVPHAPEAVAVAEAVAPEPPSSPPPSPPAPPATEPGPGPVAGSSPGKKKTGLLIGIVAALSVVILAAVVLVLVLVVFKPADASATVEKFFRAAETNNTSEVPNLVDLGAFKRDTDLEAAFMNRIFKGLPTGVKFVDIEYETKTTGDRAVVKVVKGTVTAKQDGKDEKLDAAENLDPFDAVKKDGKWYLTVDSFSDVLAQSYREVAENAMSENFVPATAKVSTSFRSLGEYLSEDPSPSVAQIDKRIASTKKELDAFGKVADETRKRFEALAGLEGDDMESQREYAEAGIGLIDTTIDLYEESIELLEYTAQIREQAETDPTGIDLDAMNEKISGSTARIDELQMQQQEYQAKLNELE